MGALMGAMGGGGGMSASSSATNGDFGSDNSYNVGNMTFGAVGANSGNKTMLIIAGVAVLGLLVWSKK